MKKLQLTIIAAVCSLVMCATVNAQKPTLESLLPQSMIDKKNSLTDNYNSFMKKVTIAYPKFSINASKTTNFNSSFFDFKKVVSDKSNVSETNLDDMVTLIAAQSDSKVLMTKILNDFKTSLEPDKGLDDIADKMIIILQSSLFSQMSDADKATLYYTFLNAKISYDFSVKNKIYASNNRPMVLLVFDNNVIGKSGASINSSFFTTKTKCYFICWVAGIKPEHAYKICEESGAFSN